MACKVILYSTPHIQKSTGFERHDPFLLVALTWNDPYICIYIGDTISGHQLNGSCLSNSVDFCMWGVLYNITLHAKRDVSSTNSYQYILPGIFDLGKIKSFVSFFKSTVFHGYTRKFIEQ